MERSTKKFGKSSKTAELSQTQDLGNNMTPSQWHAAAQELLENTALTHRRASR